MSDPLIFIVDSEHDGDKAGRYLRTVCKLSARTLAKIKRTEGALTINGQLLRTIDTIHSNDTIKIIIPIEENEIVPVEGNLEILYEDEYIVIVNKPSDMPVHPVKTHQMNTLANIFMYKYRGEDTSFHAINRLDRNTSGAVIIAKDRHTASLMQGTPVTKHYTAVCHGKIIEKDTIDAPIALRKDSKIVRCVSADGQRAITHYTPVYTSEEMTVIDVTLETGRTHQIRCHMSSIGHPLLGDDLYGGFLDLIDRQALHCESICFEHPFSHELIKVVAPQPSDISKLIRIITKPQNI